MPDALDPSIYRIRASFHLTDAGGLGIMLWDYDLNTEDPVYFVSISRAGVEQLGNLMFSGGPGLVFPATSLADYLAYVDHGELPPGSHRQGE